MKKLFLALFCVWQLLPAKGQIHSFKQADSIRSSLSGRRKDTSQINALVMLADYYIDKPGENKADLDSADDYLTQARQMSAAIANSSRMDYITLTESFLWKERGRQDTAKQLCALALKLIKAQKDNVLLGKAYFSLSEYYDYDRTDQRDVRILLADSALRAYREAGQLERLAFTFKNLADLHINNKEIDKALAECDSCLQIYKTIHFPWVQPVYDLIGSAYYQLGDYKQALSNGLHALAVAQELHDSTMQRCEIEYNVAAVSLVVRDTVRGIAHLSSALAIALLHHDKSNAYLVASDLIRIYSRSGTPEMGLRIIDDLKKNFNGPDNLDQRFMFDRCYVYTYTALHEFHKAQPYIDELVNLAKAPGVPPDTYCGIYLVVIRAYLAAGKYQEAGVCLTRYQDAVRRYKDVQFRKWAYLFAFQLDTARRQYGPAIGHLIEYDRIRDSISSIAQTKEVEQLNVAYETSEKEKHIQALQDDQKLQQRALALSNQFRNFAIIGVILLLVTIAIGYSRYRLKQEKNRQLEIKQEELEKERSEVSRQNVELSRLLNENEWLLREVHHRVKNNLQIVKSLLDSQSSFLKDESAQNAIRESQHRVQTMSLIHQKLYTSTNASTIYMPDYINELVDYLKSSFGTKQRIYFRREIEINTLDVIHAVPVGLILNEIITNSIKYAFFNTQDAQITIRLFQSGENEITLLVVDNGIGLPPDFDMANNGTFGFRLINGLTEDLGGTVFIEHQQGTAIRLTFPFNERKLRSS
jgi:two-component sensor histidine kinase